MIPGSALLAQIPEAPIPAPPELLAAFDTRAATVQDVLLPRSSDRTFSARVVLGGVSRTLELHPHDIRTRGFQLLVDDGTALRQVPTPPSVTFRGSVAGDRDSAVAASLVDGQLRALVLLDGDSWEVTPVSDAMPGMLQSKHIVFRRSDMVARDGFCGTIDAPAPLAATGPEPNGTTTYEAEVALDCDMELYQRRGSSVTNVQNDVTNIMNGVDLIYERDVDVSLLVSSIIVRTTAVYTSTTTALLSEFSFEWNTQHTTVQRDLAHLFSGKNSPGVTIGIANPASVCNRAAAYAVSWTLFSFSNQSRISLTGHEMGHNFSALHCDSTPPCYIMCSSLGGCGPSWKFEPTSITRIGNFTATRTCLVPPPPPVIPTLISATPSTVPTLRPPGITLTGTDLDTVTLLTVGGVPLTSYTIVDPTTIQFALPSGYEIATHQVVVSNVQGASNPLDVTVEGIHPAVIEFPLFHAAGLTLPYFLWTDRQWSGLAFLSASSEPSVFPGLVSFGIGSSFTQLISVTTLFADVGGFAQLDLTIPAGTTSAVTLYWQIVAFDPAVFPPPVPLEVSNVAGVTYL